ncbi:MAG: trigger factor [Clostridiales bacterium]|nr:trigger factor [Clostridiales bacterium]
MKKIVALILSLISVLVFSSCGKNTDAKTTGNGETSGGTEATTAEGTSDAEREKPEPQYDYDLTPYVKLGEYKGLDVDFVDETVTDDDVQKQIDEMLIKNEYCTEKKLNKNTVEDGDWVNIDYEGYMDGKQFDGGTAQGADLQIGSGSFIDGFESGLVGKTVGSTVSLDLHFPENYTNSPDLSGKAVTFKVKINYIAEKIPNEITDELVEEMTSGSYQTVLQLKSYLKGYMKNERINQNKNAVLDKAVENATIIAYPTDEIESFIELAVKTYTEQAENQSMDLDEYLESSGSTREQFDKELRKQAEETIKTELVVFAIAKAENIVIDDERYNTMAESYAGSYGVDAKTIENRIGSGRLMRMIMQNDVVSFLYENAAQYKPAENEN